MKDKTFKTNVVKALGRTGAAAIAVTAALTLSSCESRKTVAKPQLLVKADTVEVAGNGTVLEFPGKVTASEEVNMAFQVAGKLDRIYVGDGMRVAKGQLIASLDDRDYWTQLEAAEAEYNNVKADAERVMRLYRDSATTAMNYDKARYGLQQITAKYENCKNQLADTKIYAPFSGRIQKHYYDAPAIIGAGMPVVCLVSDGAKEVEINVPAQEYMSIGSGCTFEAGFSFMPEKTIRLRYLSTSPKANANQLYTIRLAVEGAQDGIAPGMNTIVKVRRQTQAGASVAISSSALFHSDGKTCVWKVIDGKAVRQEVVLERLASDGSAEISAGLEDGDVFITAGVHKITDGQAVSVLPAAAASNVGGLL